MATDKLTNVEAMEQLMVIMSTQDKDTLNKHVGTYREVLLDKRRLLAHGVLDAYKEITSDNTKSLLRQIYKKFMNGAAMRDNENDMYDTFVTFLAE